MLITLKHYIKPGHITMATREEVYEKLWWIYNSPKKKMPGKLHIKPGGIWLFLNGSFHEDPRSYSFSSHQLLLGAQSGGGRFVLEDCVEIQRRFPWLGEDGYTDQGFIVDRVYAGIHVEDPLDLKFDKYTFRYTYLEDWLRNVGTNTPVEVDGGFFISYDPNHVTTVPKIEVGFDEATVEIVSRPRPFVEGEMRRSGVQTEEFCEVRSKTPLSVGEVSRDFLEPIRDFLTLATARSNSITSLSAWQTVETDLGPQPFEIKIFTESNYPSVARSSLFNRGVVLFHAKEIADNPSFYLRKWKRFESEMRDVCELFFGVRYDQGAFSSNRLINTVQTLEAFSRARYGGTLRPEKEYEAKVSEILQAVPKTRRRWLKNALKYANNRTLKDRLLELLEKGEPVTGRLVQRPDSFCQWVVDTRNFLTHIDRKGKKHIAAGDDLDLMTHTLLWLIRIHFLLEAGFGLDRCEKMLEDNKGFKELSSLLKKNAPWDSSESKAR